MLANDLIEKTTEVINRIMNDCAYIFTDPIVENKKPDLSEWQVQGVSLSYSGHKSGIISLCAGEDFLCCAAANMLGIDEESEEAAEKGMDALKEILNMIVGNFLTAIYGNELIFDIGIPERLSPELIAIKYQSENAIWLEAENCPIMFELDIH